MSIPRVSASTRAFGPTGVLGTPNPDSRTLPSFDRDRRGRPVHLHVQIYGCMSRSLVSASTRAFGLRVYRCAVARIWTRTWTWTRTRTRTRTRTWTVHLH